MEMEGVAGMKDPEQYFIIDRQLTKASKYEAVELPLCGR